MSINVMTFSQNMTKELDDAVEQKPVTGFFADNSLQVKFVGANTVQIPRLEMAGLGDYDRDNGFSRGSITVNRNTYTLAMDRGRSFQLDREDEDDAGIAGLAGQVLGEFVRTKVVPEVDDYCLSKLADLATENTQTVTGTPATEAYKMLTTAIANVQSVVGYDEELVAFLNGTMWNALQNSTELSRHIEVSNFKKGSVDTQVKSMNGVALLPVPDSRMKTKLEFFDGTTEEPDGGFGVTNDSLEVGMLVMPKRAASLIKKTEQVRTFDPAHNLNADAWKFDYRLYYDLFVRHSMEDGIYVYTY